MDKTRRQQPTGNAGKELPVHIASGKVELEGALELPAGCIGVVLFAHGSGSSPHSPRHHHPSHPRPPPHKTWAPRPRRAARRGPLLTALLPPEEDADHERRFDIALLTRRLSDAVRFLQRDGTAKLPIGLFGASTGAAPALQ